MQTNLVTRRWPESLRSVCIFLIAALFSIATGYAQTAGTGSIQGTIADPTGAVIQNSSVTITDTATGVQHKTTTGADGLYSFPNIPIGTYTLDVLASGFEHYIQSGIVLEVGSSISINAKLTVGATNQNVEVQAAGLALQTEDPSFKQTIDQKTLTELPLNGRQVTSLITLSGGSANANEGSDLQGSKTFYSSVVVSVGGGMGNATDYRLDGGDHNDYMTNVNLPFPFPDAVSQFSVETSALGAQSGLHPGGLVNVVTRSGSNQWHGSVFEFIRNNYINATNFFSTKKDTLHQNQYGGTFGGRIIRDKLFFFGGYQHLKADQTQPSPATFVPTPANLQGDFSVTDSAACQSNGKANQLLNPFTGAVLKNNQISPSLFNATSLKLLQYLPQTTDPCGSVQYPVLSEQKEDQIIGRIDSTINQNHSLYGRYFYDDYNSPAFWNPANILITTQPGNAERAQGVTIGEMYVINSNTVNSFHATFTRRRNNRGAAATGIGPSSVGINTYAPSTNFFQLTVTNKWSIYCGTCAAAHFNDNTFSVADDLNMVRGKHQLAFGGEFVRAELNINNLYQSNGNFGMSGTYSQKGPAGNSSSGGPGTDANLDFLTGALSSYSQSKAQQNALRAPIPSLYIQDTYHATKKLVLSAGVRWDPEFVPVDYFNRGSIFDMTSFLNNIHSTVFPNAPAGSFYYGDKGVSKAFTENSPWQFSPRVGVTFDPTGEGKTVFRAGAAIVYDELNFFTAQRVNQNPPFATAISNVPVGVPLNFTSPWSNGTTTTNPFPLPFKPPASTTFANQSQYIVLPKHFHSPYTIQRTLSIQQDVGHGWQFQIDYIGAKTSFNAYGYPLNPAVYIPGTCGSSACSTTGNTASRYYLTRLNPTAGPGYAGGGGGSILIASGANAFYDGMVASIQHRLSSNFSFLANYTWSHCIDIEDNPGDIAGTTVQNPVNIQGDKSNCGFDFRNIFNSTMVISSKFALTGWKAMFINNWQLAPLIHIQDGAPFTVTSGIDNSLTATGNDRPNVTNPYGIYTHKKITQLSTGGNRSWINASAFAQNPAGTFGNSGRFAYRGPGYFQLDAAVSRTFPLHERLALGLRIEAFNVLNHPAFAAPGSTAGNLGSTTSLSSGTFGQITSTLSSYGARVFQGAAKITF